MNHDVTRLVRFTFPLCAGMVCGTIPAFVLAEEAPPQAQLERLGAEDFKERMAADGALRRWAESRPDGGKKWLLQQMRQAGEPEIRMRLRSILRDRLVDEALAKAPGYVGIRMNEMPAVVPGEELARAAVQVTQVIPGAPSDKAGMQAGDLIVGLDGRDFGQGPAVTAFSNRVAGMKPGTTVKIEVLRAGKVETLAVRLAGRPLSFQAFSPGFFPGAVPPADPQQEEEAARERLLREWLGKQPPAAELP